MTKKHHMLLLSAVSLLCNRDEVYVSALASPRPDPPLPKKRSRRHFLNHALSIPLMTAVLSLKPNNANAGNMNDTTRRISITLQSPAETLGVEIADGMDGRVRVKRIITPQYPDLQEGMVVDDVSSAKELISRLRNGPYPMKLAFLDDNRSFASEPSAFQFLSIVSTKRPDRCDLVGTRGEVIEIVYDAYFVTSDGREILYDASSFRGTGQPYQMVLGSGDMIPGVDQGIVGMCVGESRTLRIPKVLGHGVRSRKLFGIPDDYLGLIWQVELVRTEPPVS